MSENLVNQEGTIDRVKHTAIGQYVQSRLFLGLPIEQLPNTTLNQKFGINHKTTRVGPDEQYKAIYFCIGDGGSGMEKSADRPAIPDLYGHDPSDCALYHHLPFVLRPINNDLTNEQRSRYRLRRKELHNGIEYFAYYARVLSYEATTRILAESIVKGVSDVKPYEFTENNLSPKEPTLQVREKVTASNTKLKVSTGASLVFDENDIRELINVSKILYGTARYAVITEMSIIGGVDDQNYTSPDDGKRINELKMATTICFFNTYHLLSYTNTGFKEVVELGEKTPLPTTSKVLATISGNQGSPDTGRGVGG